MANWNSGCGKADGFTIVLISRDNAESHLEVIHLPGHTPGSIGILYSKEKMLCTGDMLFESFPMLDHYPGQGSRHDFKVSMEKIIDMINHGKVEDVSLQNLVLQLKKLLEQCFAINLCGEVLSKKGCQGSCSDERKGNWISENNFVYFNSKVCNSLPKKLPKGKKIQKCKNNLPSF